MRKYIVDCRGQAAVEYVVILTSVVLFVFLLLGNSKISCNVKSVYIELSYKIYISFEGVKDSELLFEQFMDDNGWDSSKYNYNEGKIQCAESSSSDTVTWI